MADDAVRYEAVLLQLIIRADNMNLISMAIDAIEHINVLAKKKEG